MAAAPKHMAVAPEHRDQVSGKTALHAKPNAKPKVPIKMTLNPDSTGIELPTPNVPGKNTRVTERRVSRQDNSNYRQYPGSYPYQSPSVNANLPPGMMPGQAPPPSYSNKTSAYNAPHMYYGGSPHFNGGGYQGGGCPDGGYNQHGNPSAQMQCYKTNAAERRKLCDRGNVRKALSIINPALIM